MNCLERASIYPKSEHAQSKMLLILKCTELLISLPYQPDGTEGINETPKLRETFMTSTWRSLAQSLQDRAERSMSGMIREN